MSDKRLSLEHIIRNIAEGKFTPSNQPKINLEHAIRNVHEGIGVEGSDKPQGTPTQFLNRRYSSQNGGHTSAGKGVHAKQKQADPIKMEATQITDMSGAGGGNFPESGKKKKESAPSDMSGVTIATEDVPNYGNAATVAQWPAAESGKKKIKKESGGTMGGQNNEVGEYGRNVKEENEKPSEGTVERRKVKNVARFNDFNPKSSKSVLGKQGQIKTKIIDEAKDCECEKDNDNNNDKENNKVKTVKGKTTVDLDPKLKTPTVDGNTVKEDTVDEGKVLDTAKKMGRVAGVVGALGAHAGKTYDAANIATHSDDPGLATATMLSYANPHSRMLNMLPTAFKADKAGAGEDEFKRQQKFKKQVTQKEETEMSDEVNNPLIDAFLKLQGETGNMFEAAKHLSAKQKKIAKVAGDKSKIDAADFAALRAGKKMEYEEVEQIDEVKSGQPSWSGDAAARARRVKTAQKNYASKDPEFWKKVDAANDKREQEAKAIAKARGYPMSEARYSAGDYADDEVKARKEEPHNYGYDLDDDNKGNIKTPAKAPVKPASSKIDKSALARPIVRPNTDKSALARPTVRPNTNKPLAPKYEEVEEIDEISGAKAGAYMVASKKDETARRNKGIEVRDQLRKETGMHFGTPIDRKLHSPTASRGAMQKLAVKKLTGTAKVPATENVEFSPEELAHFEAVAKTDPTNKGSFKKAGVTPNGDPVRPTVPTRDLTDSVEIHEGRPKNNEKPESTDRDPRQHIQVVAGQAAAGRHIEFKHNDGSKTTITPQHGRKIVAHLNSLKPADKQNAVNKMHDSSKGMNV